MNTSFNLENFISDFSTKCNKVQCKNFTKNEIITTYIQKRNQLCILTSGTADFSNR